jgi:hypothetical protein
MDWEALAAASTAAASIIALVTIWITHRTRHHEAEAREAAALREEARAYAIAAARAATAISKGPMVYASLWRVATGLREIAGMDMTGAELRKQLGQGGIGLSAAAVGWFEASNVHGLTKNIERMSLAEARLTGELNLLPVSGDILLAVVSDTFDTVCRQLSDGEALEMMLTEIPEVETAGEFISILTPALVATTAMYVWKRYEKVLDLLVNLVEAEADLVAGLESSRLLSLSRRQVDITFESTRTGEVRSILDRLVTEVPPATHQRLLDLVDGVESALEVGRSSKSSGGPNPASAP